MQQPDIYMWATAGFSRFKGTWKFDDFWTRGNTFDACLRFVMAARAKWPGDETGEEMETFLRQMIADNQTYFCGKAAGDLWADDFGWWGIAWLTAREYLLSVGDAESAEKCLKLAEESWVQMATRVYDWSGFAQPVPHGCGNSISTIREGTKNTVTNANLFVLSLRLYDAAKETDRQLADSCLAMSYSQCLWFSRWFESSWVCWLLWSSDREVGTVKSRSRWRTAAGTDTPSSACRSASALPHDEYLAA